MYEVYAPQIRTFYRYGGHLEFLGKCKHVVGINYFNLVETFSNWIYLICALLASHNTSFLRRIDSRWLPYQQKGLLFNIFLSNVFRFCKYKQYGSLHLVRKYALMMSAAIICFKKRTLKEAPIVHEQKYLKDYNIGNILICIIKS